MGSATSRSPSLSKWVMRFLGLSRSEAIALSLPVMLLLEVLVVAVLKQLLAVKALLVALSEFSSVKDEMCF